ncbi:MAG: cupin-like domain-containing protein [Paraglaciecola polaris]|uniref:cupin-like domain-containing protein n=1 Tax=Paraglaciecola polaris TaxID=222814 RepID=UPI00300289AC|tara:strand:- start:562 stop:1437 length:876 start_codon:yes stop_codon:yes gene_type:complete
MKLEIEKRDLSSLSYTEFVNSYLIPEKPLIIQNVFTFDTTVLTPEYILEHFSNESKREAGWFDSDLVDSGPIRIPELVKKVLSRDDMSVRQSPMRLFMQPGGHVTLPHYDGNSLHGLNLQVLGTKHWILTSPNTPLPNIPFMFAGSVGKNFTYDPHKYDFFEFDTEVGDLLLVPRYWYHEVHSIDPVNLNLNWVFTPKTPNQNSILGRREVEIVKLRKSMPLVNKAFFPDKFSEYGGQGKQLIDTYSENVGTLRMFTRLLKELSGYPRLLFLASQIKARANEFSKNNFNVK